jgi:hypothetical protein
VRDYFGRKLGNMILRSARRLNPIDISRATGAAKAAKSGLSPGGSIGASLFDDVTRSFKETAKTWDAIKATGKQPGLGQMASQYFKGYNLREVAGELGAAGYSNRLNSHATQVMMKNRARWRMGTFGAIGLSAGASLVAGDNFMSTTLNTAITGGTHLMGASLMGRYGGQYGGYAQAGYMGWAGLNALRSGNQFGPF